MGWKILAGRVNLIAGMGDVGKDTLCCTIAAHVSQGRAWPDGKACRKGLVGYMTTEDDIEDTLKPRLMAAGADEDNVVIWSLERPPNPVEITNLSLMVISPLIEMLPDGKEANSERDVRQFIRPWKDVAASCGCTILAIVHYNKKNDLAAIQRILGSVGLPNALRNTMVVERDDEEDGLRLLLNAKGNLLSDAEKKCGLAYTIEQVGLLRQSIVAVWRDGAVTKSVDQVIKAKMSAIGGKVSAIIWLRKYLKEHGETLKSMIIQAAVEAGHSEYAIQQARKVHQDEIADSQVGFPAKAYWRLKNDDR